jgi:hypothetical protein
VPRILAIRSRRRDAPPLEEAFQHQQLPTVRPWLLRQQAQLGKAVNHHPLRVQGFNALGDLLYGLAELGFGWIQHRLLVLQLRLSWHQFEDLDICKRPTVRLGGAGQFLRRLGKCDIEAPLAVVGSFEQETQAQGRFARPRCSLDQVQPVHGQPAAQDSIKFRNAGPQCGHRLWFNHELPPAH